MKHIFIINPISGHHDAIQLIPWIESYFKDRKQDYVVHLTQYPKHATELAAQYHVSDDVCIYACGGDGTVNEVLNGLAPDVPMAIIPVGTGNDFYRMLKLKNLNLKDVLIKTIEGKQVEVDSGLAQGRRFLDSVSIGFDANVGYDANQFARIKWLPSKLVYLASVFKNLSDRKAQKMTLDFNGQTLVEEVLIVALMNGQFYGGGFLPTPQASIQDGYFDVCVIENTNLANVLRLLPKYMKGTHIDEPIVKFYKTQAIRIETILDNNVQSDGEMFRTKILDVRILPKSVQLRVPEESALS